MTAKGRQFSLGLDYGTESVRAILMDTSSGDIAGSEIQPYRRGVIERHLPDSKKKILPQDWALQDPEDYLLSIRKLIPQLLKRSKVKPESVIGIGVDFTACTVLPAKSDGTPLSSLAAFKGRPHAWTKLWKHHGAQDEADEINQVAAQSREPFLSRYGGKVSSEWMLPKLLEILRDDPEIARAMDKFIEAQDWIVWQLTGNERRSSCGAGYKGTWSKRDGFPSQKFLATLHPDLPALIKQKVGDLFFPPGTRAGGLSPKWAGLTGLQIGTPVAVSIIDAHAGVLGAGVSGMNEMVVCLGTSSCHLILAAEGKLVPGICGTVEDGILPGSFAYEAGQPAVGDCFGWFLKNANPGFDGGKDAQKEFLKLEKEASGLLPGQSGLLALDWWNGNRSVLVDANLSGMILGLTLRTKPHEIYRALIEATAMGTKKIIDQFEEAQIPVRRLHATGGLAERSPLLLQIYADVTGKIIEAVEAPHVCARGAAILGGIAAHGDLSPGGIAQTIARMSPCKRKFYEPDLKNHSVYQNLYREYLRLHDYFGGENPVMRKLKVLSGEG